MGPSTTAATASPGRSLREAPRAAPLRVLHVFGQMNRGGAETWVMQVLRAADRAEVAMDFLVGVPEPGHYDAEIAALGAAVVRGEPPAHPLRFARRLRAVLRERGPYDAVHSHVHHFSGFVLAVARAVGVPVRIAHSHLDTADVDRAASPRRRAYLGAMETLIRQNATDGLAAGSEAAAALFGPRWREDGRFRIARYGLDFRRFREPVDAAAVRAGLGLAPGALVLGHVGRFDPQKNHALLVRIAAAALRREPRAVLVLVGDGPLRPAVEAEAARLGIRERLVFTGVRADVASLLRAFDALVFPSLREGLPLVGLEAQAAGVPLVLSDAITRELTVVPELFTWRSLEDAPEAWAESALAAARAPRARVDTVAALEASPFSIANTIGELLDVYRRGG